MFLALNPSVVDLPHTEVPLPLKLLLEDIFPVRLAHIWIILPRAQHIAIFLGICRHFFQKIDRVHWQSAFNEKRIIRKSLEFLCLGVPVNFFSGCSFVARRPG